MMVPMPRDLVRWGVLAVLAGCVPWLAQPSAAAAAQPLETAVVDPFAFVGPDGDRLMARVRASGASTVRIQVRWALVAPRGSTRPPGFDPANPTDPAYLWADVDAQVVSAVRHHLKPMVDFYIAPNWAQRSTDGPFGTRTPDPAEVGSFARAIARRYSGKVLGLPRVRLWQLWNEPNIYRFLTPQFDSPLAAPVPSGARALSPGLYRDMLNAFATGVRGVSKRNVVITGGMTPFGRAFPGSPAVAPLRFMRELLCLTPRNRPDPNCRQRASFDVWAHHPYTDGGPNHSAEDPQNVSLGDLRKMKRVLAAAIRTGRIRSQQKVRFWVTEFSWDTRPPDPGGVPVKTHARWVAEALYRMWSNGVSLVTWYSIRDEARDGRPDPEVYQSSLYYRCASGVACDRPKPALTAFRFPFVALPSGRRTVAWGRTPFGRRARVRLETRRGGRWRPVATLRTDAHGIFLRRLTQPRKGMMRAVVVGRGGARSGSFRIGRTRDMEVRPFG